MTGALMNAMMFFLNDTATTEIYTLSLHDALPIYRRWGTKANLVLDAVVSETQAAIDRKSTRLNSIHVEISYAVFCLKKKIKKKNERKQRKKKKKRKEEKKKKKKL